MNYVIKCLNISQTGHSFNHKPVENLDEGNDAKAQEQAKEATNVCNKVYLGHPP